METKERPAGIPRAKRGLSKEELERFVEKARQQLCGITMPMVFVAKEAPGADPEIQEVLERVKALNGMLAAMLDPEASSE